MPQKTFETCGGDFYSGDKTCESGNCAKKDTNYSQCLPVGLGFNSAGVIVDLATGLIPGDVDIEHAKNPVAPDPVQAEKQKQAIIDYEAQKTAEAKKNDQAKAVVPPPSPPPATTTIAASDPKTSIVQTAPSTTSPVTITLLPNLQPQKQEQPPAVTSSLPPALNPEMSSASAIPGALIGTSIGLLMFSIVAYLLFSRYRSRKSLRVQSQEWDFEIANSLQFPHKSYLNL